MRFKKTLAAAATLSMMLTAFAGTAPALADDNGAAELSMSRIYTIRSNAAAVTLGNLQITESSTNSRGISPTGDMIELILPDEAEFNESMYRNAGWKAGAEKDGMKLSFSSSRVLDLTLYGDAKGKVRDAFSFPLYITVDDLTTDTLTMQVDGCSTSIPDQSIQIASVAETGTTASCLDEFTIAPEASGLFTLRLTENVANSIDEEKETIRLELPDNMMFEAAGASVAASGALSGSEKLSASLIDGNVMEINLKDLAQIVRVSNTTRGMLDITAKVTSNADVAEGPVIVTVSGSRNINTEDVAIGRIGSFEVTVDTDAVPELLSGRVNQEAGKIIVTENVPDSFVAGEDIHIALPDGVKFATPYDTDDIEVIHGTATFTVQSEDSSSVDITLDSVKADDDQVKFEFPMTLNIEAGYEGGISAQVSGRAGAEGAVTIGNVIVPVTVNVLPVPTLQSGKQDQDLGALKVSETETGALKQGQTMTITFPMGMQLNNSGYTYKVTSGNLTLDSVRVTEAAGKRPAHIDFTVTGASIGSEPSVLEITGLKASLNTGYQNGPMNFTLSGGALIDSYKAFWLGQTALWNYHDYNGEKFASQDEFRKVIPEHLFTTDFYEGFTFAYCAGGTDAVVEEPVLDEDALYDEEDYGADAVFTIGSRDMLLNGELRTMHVSPYIENGRTLLPVRYVAYACGVPEDGVLWDSQAHKVTLSDGKTDVQLVIGDSHITVNGVTSEMDVPAEITDDYTFLPGRYVAEAFGFTVAWDADDQQVVITK